jgi:hypothetical protein
MPTDASKRWEEMLTPEIVRVKFIAVGLLAVAYEMLEDTIVGRVRDFFSTGFDAKGFTYSPDYATRVLALDPKGKGDALRSSLVWLRQVEAITEEDHTRFLAIKNARNEVAHELTSILTGERTFNFNDHFQSALALLSKIERWWIVNVEIATDPDLVDKEIDEDGILPGRILTMQILVNVALGNDKETNAFLEAFRRAQAKEKC